MGQHGRYKPRIVVEANLSHYYKELRQMQKTRILEEVIKIGQEMCDGSQDYEIAKSSRLLLQKQVE